METEQLIIAISVGVSVIMAMFLRTKFFIKIMWIVLFAYPHSLTADLLPLNIGIDDLYVMVLFTILFFKRSSSGSLCFRFATIGALLFWMINSVGAMTGALTGPDYLMESAIKTTLKGISYVAFGFIMDNSIDSDEDVNSLLKWMIFAGVCGTITAIGQVFYEPFFQIFTLYRPEEWQVETIRGGGAFLNPNAAGVMMVVFLVFCITKLQTGGLFTSKPLLISMSFLFVFELFLSGSRSAWFGTALLLLFMLIFSPLRKYILIIIIGAAIGILTFGFIQAMFTRRLGTASTSALGRVDIWITIIKNTSPFIMFCGRGAVAEFIRLDATPHNTYLHIIFEMGLFGTVWAVWFFSKLFRTSRFIIKYGNIQNRASGYWCLYSLVGIAGFGMALEVLFIQFMIYVLFFMAALLHYYKLQINDQLMYQYDEYEDNGLYDYEDNGQCGDYEDYG